MVELMSLFGNKQEKVKALVRDKFGSLFDMSKIISYGELGLLKQIKDNGYVDNYELYLQQLPLNLIENDDVPELGDEDKEWNSQQENIVSQELMAVRNLYNDWSSLTWRLSDSLLKDSVLPVVLTFLMNAKPQQIHEAIELHSNVIMDQMTFWESDDLIPKLFIDMFDAIALYLKQK